MGLWGTSSPSQLGTPASFGPKPATQVSFNPEPALAPSQLPKPGLAPSQQAWGQDRHWAQTGAEVGAGVGAGAEAKTGQAPAEVSLFEVAWLDAVLKSHRQAIEANATEVRAAETQAVQAPESSNRVKAWAEAETIGRDQGLGELASGPPASAPSEPFTRASYTRASFGPEPTLAPSQLLPQPASDSSKLTE